MTFWFSNDNYGQLLQCYALQKFLRDLGHEPFLIRYDFRNDFKKCCYFYRYLKLFNPKYIYKYLLCKIKSKEEKSTNRFFDDFRSKYILQSKDFYTNYTSLFNNPPNADAYIVGSDQVWNTWFTDSKKFINQIHAYFLDFGDDKTKRLSYAASWGVTSVPDKYCSELNPLLSKFDYVSVREKTGILLCEKCGYTNAEWVCDPTLLLTPDIYRGIYKENEIRKPEKPFILLYMLGNECNFDIQIVYNFAKQKELDVVYVTGNNKVDKKNKYFATIPEWLYLVDNAEYVITNSFHCAVFSIIFHKKFGVIRLSGKAKEWNSRFDSLFSTKITGNRYLDENDFSNLEKDYEEKDIKVSYRFLNALL